MYGAYGTADDPLVINLIDCVDWHMSEHHQPIDLHAEPPGQGVVAVARHDGEPEALERASSLASARVL